VDECVEVCRRLKELGVDMIDVSSGGLDSAQKFPNPLLPGYQVLYMPHCLSSGIAVAGIA
jgi:hypothetical protein